jgi:ATP-dependent protease HslVU (ClpYQ) peptidase subunit
MVVADANTSLQITGTGDVLEPHDGIVGAFPYSALLLCPFLADATRALWLVHHHQPSDLAARMH